MTSSMIVPVIDVQNDNFKELWPAMVMAIKMASFVALDTELSGLGNRKSLLAESIEDRFKAICHAARSRSILSLGIACYKKLDKAADTYLVQVYNLTLLCSEEYIIEPQSVQFLVQHGFDFNKQYAHGIPYCKGNNKGGLDNHGVHIRTLFTELLRARKPLVLHNGLIDIAFLYQCFYAHLPERLDTFTADLSEMFPAGIYDTKYITEFELRLTASYLEYAYKKCKLDNSRSVTSEKPGRHVYVEFCQYPGTISSYVDFRVCPDVVSADAKTEICERFSGFGWCPNGTQCPLSHDTDLIVLQDEMSKGDKRKRRKRKREKKKEGEVPEATTGEDDPQSKMPHMEVDLEGGDVHLSAPLIDSATPQNEGENEKMGSDGNGVCEHKLESADSETAPMISNDTESNSGVEKGSTKESQGQSDKKADTGTHRAGFDAFMTGYIFAYSCTLSEQEAEACVTAEKEKEGEEEEETWLLSSLNKVYLSGKRAPLNIVKSTFAKSSKAHMQKMEMVWGGRK